MKTWEAEVVKLYESWLDCNHTSECWRIISEEMDTKFKAEGRIWLMTK